MELSYVTLQKINKIGRDKRAGKISAVTELYQSLAAIMRDHGGREGKCVVCGRKLKPLPKNKRISDGTKAGMKRAMTNGKKLGRPISTKEPQ